MCFQHRAGRGRQLVGIRPADDYRTALFQQVAVETHVVAGDAFIQALLGGLAYAVARRRAAQSQCGCGAQTGRENSAIPGPARLALFGSAASTGLK